MVRLDPKLDVVFKILFADPSNKDLLLSLLSAVLRPQKPIVDAEVLIQRFPGSSRRTRASCSISE